MTQSAAVEKPLPDRVRAALAAVAEPERAPAMQAYMKSAMPFLGVAAGPRQAALRAVFADIDWPDAAAWATDVRALWHGAAFREERYAAIALTGVKAARRFQTIAALPLYETMIVSGAWWDYVDELAGHRLWGLLRNDRAAMTAAMRDWASDADLWKRRSAILCQLPAKRETDLDLLYACIEPSLDRPEFFLRKAIGWALRQYAHTDPAQVTRYVAVNADRLSTLSRREAVKRIG